MPMSYLKASGIAFRALHHFFAVTSWRSTRVPPATKFATLPPNPLGPPKDPRSVKKIWYRSCLVGKSFCYAVDGKYHPWLAETRSQTEGRQQISSIYTCATYTFKAFRYFPPILGSQNASVLRALLLTLGTVQAKNPDVLSEAARPGLVCIAWENQYESLAES